MRSFEGMGLRVPCPLSLVLLLLLAGAGPSSSAEPEQMLLRTARERRLSDAPYWRTLGHYQTRWGRTRSLIDDSRFFLAPRGKVDPEAELEATILGLFTEDVDGRAHPRCRFPARYGWLRRELSLDDVPLPEVACPDLEASQKHVNPRSVALVFPSAHGNSPASMFGHTLLRIDSEYESTLLSYAVNYSAQVGAEENALVYATRGIFGYYPGYYTILPYYQKVQGYNNIEQRDVWEYELNLTAMEARQLFLHAWELKDIYSDYYYFDENCSYNILFLLEAARPSVSLTTSGKPWITPVDTISDVRAAGLVREVLFRPSRTRKIRQLAASLTDEDAGLAKKIAAGEAEAGEDGVPAPPLRAARILDLASEVVQLRLSKKELSPEQYRPRFRNILGARSRLTEGAPPPAPPRPESPDRGHASSRVSLGFGTLAGEEFVEVSVKPAYHELLDPEPGYDPGSQIDFLHVAARYGLAGRELRLHRLDLVQVVSLAPRDEFFPAFSWKVLTGLATRSFGEEDGLVYTVNLGGGLAWQRSWLGIGYVFAEGSGDVSARYRDGYAAGGGVSAGILRSLGDAWKVQLQGRHLYYGLGDERWESVASLRQSVRLARNHSVFVDATRTLTSDAARTEFRLAWNVYF